LVLDADLLHEPNSSASAFFGHSAVILPDFGRGWEAHHAADGDGVVKDVQGHLRARLAVVRARVAWRRAVAGAERGTVSVIAALAMTAMAGMLALVVDIGFAYGQRRMAQNAADSGALAAAKVLAANYTFPGSQTGTEVLAAIQDVTGNSSGAFGSGFTARYLDSSGAVISTVSTGGVIPSNAVAVRVVPAKTVNTFFAPVLGFASINVNAGATGRVYVAQGIDQNHPDFAPYGVWGGEQPKTCSNGTTQPLCPGDVVTYRANDYENRNVVTGQANWTGNANNFKGFLHKATGVLTSSSFVTSGGNAFGEEPLDMMQAHFDAGDEGAIVIMPVVDRQQGNGSNTQFRIAGFVAVRLLNRPEPPGSHPWTAEIVAGPLSFGALVSTTPPTPGTINALVTRLVS
jgi:Flp pilus assembly protein TadG